MLLAGIRLVGKGFSGTNGLAYFAGDEKVLWDDHHDVVDGLADPAELDPFLPRRDADQQQLADIHSEHAGSGKRKWVLLTRF
jgi:hypothetical protein